MRPEPVEPTDQIASERSAGSPIGTSDKDTTAEVQAPAGKHRRRSIRLRLAYLVIVCVLPVWIAAGFLVYHNYQTKRALTEQRMLETARALTMVVDRELGNMQASLSVLATTPSLASGDLRAFYNQAWLVLEAYPGAYILLADATGQELVNTISPFGAPLPKHSLPDAVRQVYATGRPVITNAFKGVFTGRFLVSVHVPVFRNGRVVYDLAMNVPTDRVARVLLLQNLPPEWLGAIFDSNQVIVSRSRLADEFVGRHPGPAMGQRMRDTAEGTAETTNLEGTRMYNSFSRSATSGWTVAMGVPKAIMMAEIWRWLWWTLAGTALLSLAGVALALLMARRIADSIQGLIAPVLALGRGESVAIRHLELTEFDEAGESLVKASQLIQQRAAERERAEAACRETEDLKRLNAELERSEAAAHALATELAAILDAVPAITFIARDRECQWITSNRTGYDLLRLPPGANTSRSAPDGERASGYHFQRDGLAVSPDELPVQLAAATGREVRDCEYTIAFDDGSSRSIFGNAVPLLDDTGRVRGVVGAFIDITELKCAKKQLQATAERLQKILDEAPIGINVAGHDTRLVETNAALQRITGYSAEELKGMSFLNFTHPDDRQHQTELVDQLRNGTTHSYLLETRCIRKDGQTIWVRAIGSRLDDEHSVGIVEDITEHKQAVEQLRRSETRLRRLIESNIIGVIVRREAGGILEANDAFLQITGYAREDLADGLNWRALTVPEYEARDEAMLEEMRQLGRFRPYEKEYFRKDGSRVPVVIGGVMTEADEAIVFVLDLTERKKAQIELERLARIVESAEDAIISLALDGTILSWNKGAERLYGYSQREMIGASEDILLPADGKAEWTAFREAAASGKGIDYFKTVRLTKTGDEKPVNLTISPIRDESGRIIGISKIARDRTQAVKAQKLEEQLKQMRMREAAELRAAKEAAEAANRAKSEFLANMSHEIRTPMNGVMGMLELALDTELSSEQRGCLETAKSSADSLLTVINDILDFSKMEAEKIALEAIDFNLRECVEEALKTLALHADEKGLELLCGIAPEAPEVVQGDSGRLRQIILNLVSNAIKFTHQGEVALKVELEKEDRDIRVVRFTVADTGIGIPAEKQQSIFDPFAQADASTTRNYGGTGLGLTISARLVSMMGGKIWLESEVGRGSQFHFTAQLRVAAKGESKPVVPAETLRNMRILVVDDNETNRQVLQQILNGWDVRATSVESGEQALGKLLSACRAGEPYQLILTDQHMPGMDGFALVEQVRRMPELSAMTVMMLTSARHHRDAERCRELGLAAYLYKPIRKQELLSSILLALGQPKTISQSATVTPLAPPALSRGLRILLAEDNRVNQAVAVRMVEKMGHSPVVANNGREALLLLAAKSFDLVLMDVQMPEMDGLKATAMIREKERQTQVHIPIIAMTAHAMKEDRERCLEAGMDGYISKPINGRKLEELIASVFHGLNDKFGASLATQKQDVASDSAITWDIGQTLERLGGDEELFHEVVEIFLEESPKQMSSLRHAIADGNAEDIERTAHSLKGDLGYLGISEVSQKASELEEMGREHNLQHTAEAFATFESGIAGVLLSMREMDGRSLKSS